MSNDQSHNHNDMVKVVGYLIPVIPNILLKLGIFYLRFKGMARKSGNIFKQELQKQGLDEATAERFTQEYLKSSHVLAMLRRQS